MGLRCWFFGHDLYVVQEFGGGARRIACPVCKGDWAQSDHVYGLIGPVTLPWNSEFEELYGTMRGRRLVKPWR